MRDRASLEIRVAGTQLGHWSPSGSRALLRSMCSTCGGNSTRQRASVPCGRKKAARRRLSLNRYPKAPARLF